MQSSRVALQETIFTFEEVVMGTKPNRTPGQFFIECPNDGIYPISEETARRFITPRLRTALDESLKNGAIGAKLKFKGGCPMCEPNSTQEIEVVSLGLRVN